MEDKKKLKEHIEKLSDTDLKVVLEYINELEERLNNIESRFIVYGEYFNNPRQTGLFGESLYSNKSD